MLLKVPTNLTDDDFLKLAGALEECPSIKDPQSRNEIINELVDRVGQVKEKTTRRGSILSILKVLSKPERRGDFLTARRRLPGA